MFNKITYKKRNRLFAAAGVLLAFLIYQYSIRNTLELRAECVALALSVDSSANAPARMKIVQQEMDELNKNLAGCDSLTSLHELLLGEVTAYCGKNDITLRDFSPVVSYKKDNWLVETHPVTVEGRYIPILQLIHSLEKEQKGKVISVDFISKKDIRTQKLSLLATIYIQNVIRLS
jgi:hypothetical protein